MSGTCIHRLTASMAALCIGGLALLTGNLMASDCCEPCSSCAQFSEPYFDYQHVPFEYRYEAGIYKRDLGPAVHDVAMAPRDFRFDNDAPSVLMVQDWSGSMRSSGAGGPDVAVGNAPVYERDVRLDIEPVLTMRQRPDLEPQAGIETSVQPREEVRQAGIWWDGRFYPSTRPRFDNSIGIRAGAVGAETPEPEPAPIDVEYRSDTGVVDEDGNFDPMNRRRFDASTGTGTVDSTGRDWWDWWSNSNNTTVNERQDPGVGGRVDSATGDVYRDGVRVLNRDLPPRNAPYTGDRLPAAGPSGDTLEMPPAPSSNSGPIQAR